ncbi:hypothetical protein PIB30_053489 [Stylosanthes scabra]|uniref:No apical meristem-associated C-terminal domain-containing protein n=1 Tax=Stylosanthes scabra TaxID=79078 RepID=A0ABU6YHT6_9FABA|nr:hypothetical protein [Stylosanthes scabra]
MGNMSPTCFQFSSQSSASRPGSCGLGASSNPSPQTLIHSSPNCQHSDFANLRGLDAIDLNDDEIRNQRQRSTPLWQWEEDEMLISASGSNANDIKELAYKIYSENYGQKFTFERHWNMLCLEEKWRGQLPKQSEGSKRTKVTWGGGYSSSSNRETPLAENACIDSPVRSQGSKKSKRRGKGKAPMSKDLSEAKSSVVKQLSLMEEFKIVREKELIDERNTERNLLQ